MTDPLLGRVLRGRYRIEHQLGQGGMGAVYAAVDTQLGRSVAVKTLLDVSDPRDVERFRTEALAAAGLKHPHIVEVFDFSPPAEDEPALLVMELLPGRSLSSLIARRTSRGLSVAEAKHLTLQILDALGAAHRARILHRDIKPSNIIVLEGPDVERPHIKIVDFGIAKLMDDQSRHTTTGVLLGTPPYMAPEQIRGERATELTDLYSVGVCLYEMLAGSRPFVGNGGELASSILRGEPPELPIDPALAAIVRRSMHHVAAQRFASADDFASALRALPGPRPAAPVEPASPTARRWPVFAGVALATLAIGGVAALVLARKPAPPPEQAPVAALPPPPSAQAPTVDVPSAEATVSAPPIESASDATPPPARAAGGVLSICSDGVDLCARPTYDCECRDAEGFIVYESPDHEKRRYVVVTHDTALRDKECRGFLHGTREGKRVSPEAVGRYRCNFACDNEARRAGARIAVPGTPCVGYVADTPRPGKWRALK